MRSLPLTIVCVLLLGSFSLIHPQNRLKSVTPMTDENRSSGANRTERSDDDDEDASDNFATSPAGKLKLSGAHVGLLAVLNIDADLRLKGPLLISVANENGPVIQSNGNPKGALELALTREKKYAVQLALGRGENLITVKDQRDQSELAVLKWSGVEPKTASEEREVKTPPADKPDRDGAPNELKWSEKRNLGANVSRAKGEVQLKVHVSNALSGFKVKVVDGAGNEVDNRSFSNLERNVNDWSLVVKTAKDDNTVTVSSLDDKESVALTVPQQQAEPAAAANEQAPPEAVEYDWGRVRGYFAGGMIFSKERDDFSKSDIFLDFTLDKNYIAKPFLIFKDFNTFFNARLTSIPVATEDAAAEDGNGTGGGDEAEPCNTPDCEGFITSKKAALMQAGIYLPMYWDFTTWYRRVPRENQKFRWEKNALFIAPLAKGGIMTITGDRETSEGQQFGGDDVFNFYSFGLMLGHFRLHARRQRDSAGNYRFNKNDRPLYEANPNIAPEMISWLTISAGRWENFEILVPTGQKDANGQDIKVRQRPWRVEALGRLKIPETPFIIGFDGNFGKGPDDVRFIFGTRFDIGKIMRTLKLAGQQDNMGQQNNPAAGNNTPAPSN